MPPRLGALQSIVPASGFTNPATVLRIVVFPIPEGPAIAMISPDFKSKLMFETKTSSYPTAKSLTKRIGSLSAKLLPPFMPNVPCIQNLTTQSVGLSCSFDQTNYFHPSFI